MKKHLLQPVLAIVALIVSVATATLCVFAWFTSNTNNNSAFQGEVIDPAITDIKLNAYLMDETTTDASLTTRTFSVSNRLGDDMPEVDPITGNNKYAMRAFGSQKTTAILVTVTLTLDKPSSVAIIAQGDMTYSSTIPTGTVEQHYEPNLSDALCIYGGVLYFAGSGTTAATVMLTVTDDTTYSMVGTDNSSKVATTIRDAQVDNLNPTFYFVLDYSAALMQGIYGRIDDSSSSSYSGLSATLDFNNDITFLATTGS